MRPNKRNEKISEGGHKKRNPKVIVLIINHIIAGKDAYKNAIVCVYKAFPIRQEDCRWFSIGTVYTYVGILSYLTNQKYGLLSILYTSKIINPSGSAFLGTPGAAWGNKLPPYVFLYIERSRLHIYLKFSDFVEKCMRSLVK